MKTDGFTLAETMITLGIIGIISALLFPAVKNMRPNENKIAFLKMHDAIVDATRALAVNSKVFPPCQEIGVEQSDGTSLSVQKCFMGYTLFNTAQNTGDDIAKYGKMLARLFGKDANCGLVAQNAVSCTCSFNANTGEYIEVKTDRPKVVYNKDPGWLSTITFDVNGEKEPNCIFDATNHSACPNPDRFKLWVTADGNVTPADRVGEYYLNTRNDAKSRKTEIDANTELSQPISQFSYD